MRGASLSGYRPFDLEALRGGLMQERGPREDVAKAATRFAAVAAVLRPSTDGAEVLLIRRADKDGDPWSGHMAFPGGHAEPGDADLVATAVRETREELGIDLATATWLGKLDDVPATGRGQRTGTLVVPFVFALEHADPFSLNAEVAEALWVPVSPLIDGRAAAVKRYVWEGRELELPGYSVGERIVWGMTYGMLATLLRRIAHTASVSAP